MKCCLFIIKLCKTCNLHEQIRCNENGHLGMNYKGLENLKYK